MMKATKQLVVGLFALVGFAGFVVAAPSTVSSHATPQLVSEINTALANPTATTLTVEGVITTTVGLDASGAVDLDYGSADVTDHTFVTDGTGDAEIVLPNDSIGDAEIAFDEVTGADLTLTDCTDITLSGTLTANGNSVLGNATNDTLTINCLIVNIPNLPTATNGLVAGDLWNSSGTLSVVQ